MGERERGGGSVRGQRAREGEEMEGEGENERKRERSRKERGSKREREKDWEKGERERNGEREGEKGESQIRGGERGERTRGRGKEWERETQKHRGIPASVSIYRSDSQRNLCLAEAECTPSCCGGCLCVHLSRPLTQTRSAKAPTGSV